MTDSQSEPVPRPATTKAAPVRLQTVVYSMALALMIGWILHIGASVLVPMVLALMLSYVVAGVSRLIGTVPVVGKLVPPGLRYLASALLIGYVAVQMVILFTTNMLAFAVRAPEFQGQLLGMIQTSATYFGFAQELTWETLRRDVLGQVNLQGMLRSGLSSSAALLGGLIFVLLNVIFMLLERRSFDRKLDAISTDPDRVALTRSIITDINARVGRYLAVKTMINIVLGLISFVIMLVFGLEFAALWAIVIAFLNYIPYIGSWIGVILPVTLAVVQFGQLETVLMLVVALSAAQFLLGNIVEPQVMGTSLDLSPYAILISLTVWTSLWGIPGAIVSVPITAVLVIVLSGFPEARPIAVLLSKTGQLQARPKPAQTR